MTDYALKVNGVSKNFKLPHEKTQSIKSAFLGIFTASKRTTQTQHALRDISFTVKKGEFFGIVGRNGSGKSTLLKMLAHIYQPTKGSVAINGRLVPFIELGVGFNPELTGRENVYLNGALLGFSKKEIDLQYDDIVAFAELGEFMDQKLKNYSSGMQVRLAFSVATTAKADILLIDEVLAVGDADFQRKCFDYFKEIKKSGTTVVFVSHDMGAVKEYCDRAILIDDSRLVASGNPEDIARDYTHLFTQSVGEEITSSARWGNERIKFTKVAVTPRKLTDKSQQITIAAMLKATDTIENPVVGYSIKDKSGVVITGTNTKLQSVKTGVFTKGDTRAFTFVLPNIFADGSYTVDIAVLESDTITVCDWWEDAMQFKSYEQMPGPAFVSPPVTIKMENFNV